MRVMRLILWTTTAIVTPTLAAADPVSAFVAGFSGAGALSGAVASAVGGLTAIGFQLGAFFGQTILGSLLLNIGLAYLLRPEQQGPPKIERAQVNTRLADATRYQLGGSVKVGGAAGAFAEYDENGNFWYIVVHGDAEMVSDPVYYLDGIEVEIYRTGDDLPSGDLEDNDGPVYPVDGDVITGKFCFTEDKKEYTGSGERRIAYRIYTVSPSSSQVYGDLPTAFTDAFPNLPADFLLAGVCYSIVRVRPGSSTAKPIIYRWRGPIGIGEPAVQVYANFTRMYDPREVAHDINDPSTWTAGDGNPVILWAWWRTNVWGRNQPMSAINWTEVAARADICDTTVLNRNGDPVPLYRCGIAIPDNQTRQEAEKEILQTMDAFVAYDDEGKAYVVPGYYEAPTLEFSAARDIFTAQTQLVNDGEQPMDGVVVEYLSPDHGYTKQPCSPWNNPDFYDAAREPNYQFVPILGCQDHNQAVRLAKAIGGRTQALNRAALGTTVKGILAKRERAIDLDYDAVFDGVHEIVSPVEEDGDGMACAFAVVPLASDRWTLNEGEEGAPPTPTPSLNIDDSLAAAANVVLISESIATDNGLGVRIRATFDAPTRESYVYRFRYAPEGTYSYEYFLTDMDGLYAYSALLNDGTTYDVQWQTVDGDRATAYSTITQITGVANSTPPVDLVAADAVAGGAGEIVYSWETGNDVNQRFVWVYRGATATFGAATLVTTAITPALAEGGLTEPSLTAGTYYAWLVPVNGSGISGTASGPFTVIVS